MKGSLTTDRQRKEIREVNDELTFWYRYNDRSDKSFNGARQSLSWQAERPQPGYFATNHIRKRFINAFKLAPRPSSAQQSIKER